MKLRKLIKEERFSKYEDFVNALDKAVDDKDYRTFEKTINDALRQKQYEWFCLYYQSQNTSQNTLNKLLFKNVAPF